jgi:hypothetical protein
MAFDQEHLSKMALEQALLHADCSTSFSLPLPASSLLLS